MCGLVYQDGMQALALAVASFTSLADDLLADGWWPRSACRTCRRQAATGCFRKDRLGKPYVSEFRDWILEEAEKSKALARGRFDGIEC